jgi:hypothetical protein
VVSSFEDTKNAEQGGGRVRVTSEVLATQKRSPLRPRRKPYVLKVVDDANVRTQVFTNRMAAMQFVRFWHKADIRELLTNVRFQG